MRTELQDHDAEACFRLRLRARNPRVHAAMDAIAERLETELDQERRADLEMLLVQLDARALAGGEIPEADAAELKGRIGGPS